MKLALISTDNRECFKKYNEAYPIVPPPQEALLTGFAEMPELEVHFISCLQTKPRESPGKLASNVYYHGLHVPKLGWMRTGYQGCVRAVRRLLREINPDVVHGQGTERDCAMCAAFSGFPSIITLHGVMASVHEATGSSPFSYYSLAKKLEVLVLKRCGGVICISDKVDKFAARYASRRWLIPNALRAVFFQDCGQIHAAKRRPVLVNVGTISPYKRQVELLRLLEDLSQSVAFTAKFVGRIDCSTDYGRSFNEALSRAQRRGADFQHIEAANADEMRMIFDAGDCMVHYSREESFGLVVAEALARNLKVFCFDVGAARAFSGLTGNCEVFPLRREGDFALRLRRWLELYPEQLPRNASPPRVILEEFSPEAIAKKHCRAYAELLAEIGDSSR